MWRRGVARVSVKAFYEDQDGANRLPSEDRLMNIREDDLSGQATQDLLRLHLAGMHSNSPPGHVFALDLSGLKVPEVTVWSVWEGDAICGIGALKRLDAMTGEIKSMRTHPDFLRKGVGVFAQSHRAAGARRGVCGGSAWRQVRSRF